MYGKRIDQFIGEYDMIAFTLFRCNRARIVYSRATPCGRSVGGRSVGGWHRCSINRIMAGVDVFGGVAEDAVQLRGGLFGPGAHALREVTPARALFENVEGGGMAESFPELIELATDAVGEEGGDVGAGVVIALPADVMRAGHVVAVAGFVEGHAHVFGEGQRPFAPDAFEDALCEWRGSGHTFCRSDRGSLPKWTTSRSKASSGVRRLRLSAASVSSRER